MVLETQCPAGLYEHAHTGPRRHVQTKQEELAPFVEFADESDAWDLLSGLLAGDTSAGDLLRGSAFFVEASNAPQ